MSKKKPRNPRKPAPAGKVPPEIKPKNSGFAKSFAQMMFIVIGALGGFYSIFVALTPKKGDTTNTFISKEMPHLMTWEWILYSVITLGFIYFSFKWIFGTQKKWTDYFALGLVFVAINGLFVMSFDRDMGSFGDNAQYIVHSKSLLEKGGPYDIYFIKESYKARAPIGLPLMLAPITATFGMDVFKMKALIFLLGGLSLVFFYLTFRKLSEPYLAALLTTLIGTYPLMVYNTSYVMTEVPFLFTIAFAMFCALKLKESTGKKQVALWITLTVLSAFLAYLTRAVGAAVIASVITWLFFHIPWLKIFKGEEKISILPTAKFGIVTAALVVLFIGLQVKTSAAVKKDQAAQAALSAQTEVVEKAAGDKDAPSKNEAAKKKSSQLAQFLSSDFLGRFGTNFKKVNRLWTQQVLNKDLSRWYLSLGKAAKIKDMNGGFLFFNILLMISLVIALARRDLLAFTFLFLLFLTLSGTSTPVIMVYSRYFIPLVPFVIYLLVRMLPDIVEFLDKNKSAPALKGVMAVFSTVFLFIMLHHNFSGNAYNIQRQNSGDAYTIAFDNYLKTGTWIKENLGEEVIVASRKPRLFYVFSERKGVYTVTYSNQVYSDELAQDRIEFFREKNVDYVILDAFSTASRKVILPLIQNNPDKFQVVQSVGEKYPSHVVRFID